MTRIVVALALTLTLSGCLRTVGAVGNGLAGVQQPMQCTSVLMGDRVRTSCR